MHFYLSPPPIPRVLSETKSYESVGVPSCKLRGCFGFREEWRFRFSVSSLSENYFYIFVGSKYFLISSVEKAMAPRPWDSPGKNTGVGCHFLLQCMKMKSESEVAQLCPTLRDPMDCSLPGSSIHGILQARVLEWGAIAFSSKEGVQGI